jgi:hypothetical protein
MPRPRRVPLRQVGEHSHAKGCGMIPGLCETEDRAWAGGWPG